MRPTRAKHSIMLTAVDEIIYRPPDFSWRKDDCGRWHEPLCDRSGLCAIGLCEWFKRDAVERG
jgi:hypothetical protein